MSSTRIDIIWVYDSFDNNFGNNNDFSQPLRVSYD